jgi:hypothetical protein
MFAWAFAAVLAAVLATDASAATMDLIDGEGDDSGWSVDIPDEFSSLVGITVDDVDLAEGTITIQKSAEFLMLDTIPILFRQDVADAPITQLIIDQEQIDNNTPVAWDGFRMQLIGFGAAAFDTADSAGFDVAPFTTKTFSNSDKTLTISGGGIVPSGGDWTPGAGGGSLVINITPATSEPLADFFLKETPVPEPATMVLVVLGGIAMVGRRRR